ncbi:MAG: phosphonate metabolism transcriptional regulator PhnF [Rhodobacteraceae bacterium]|nr:phosphonate metabolism transcriptional regulator PhnF [Paracoccaceae bacterium]
MARTALWTAIARSLTGDIAEGRFATGDRLPTEAQLAAKYGVNRHTVRRALGALAEQGLVRSRRGAGVFVTARPTDYPIGRRVRFHQNIRAGGQSPTKTLLSLLTRAADPREARALDLPEGAPVHVYDGLSLADAQPVAVFQSVFPAERLPGLPDALRDNTSVTHALAACGVADYTRVSTRITAKDANATLALHLRICEGAPILRTVGINADADGRPVEYGRTWFAGDRVTLVLNED